MSAMDPEDALDQLLNSTWSNMAQQLGMLHRSLSADIQQQHRERKAEQAQQGEVAGRGDQGDGGAASPPAVLGKRPQARAEQRVRERAERDRARHEGTLPVERHKPAEGLERQRNARRHGPWLRRPAQPGAQPHGDGMVAAPSRRDHRTAGRPRDERRRHHRRGPQRPPSRTPWPRSRRPASPSDSTTTTPRRTSSGPGTTARRSMSPRRTERGWNGQRNDLIAECVMMQAVVSIDEAGQQISHLRDAGLPESSGGDNRSEGDEPSSLFEGSMNENENAAPASDLPEPSGSDMEERDGASSGDDPTADEGSGRVRLNAGPGEKKENDRRIRDRGRPVDPARPPERTRPTWSRPVRAGGMGRTRPVRRVQSRAGGQDHAARGAGHGAVPAGRPHRQTGRTVGRVRRLGPRRRTRRLPPVG